MAEDEKDFRPIPDPTLLTTQQLQREIAALKEIIFTRLDAADKAVQLLNTTITAVPTEIDRAVSHLRELHDARFDSIQTQFKSLVVSMEKDSSNNKISLEVALQAAEKAVNKQNESFALSIAKSEASTTKQIDQQATLINTSHGALEGKIGDLKDRVTAIENKGVGQQTAQATQQVSSSFILAIVVATISFAGLLVLIFEKVATK